MNSQLKSNMFKMFIYSLSQRRHFIPILSIYFLTLPSTNVQQIGIFMGIACLASFLIEIPSGYFSDTFGHKRTLILSKILMIFSLLSFIFADGLNMFILGACLQSISFALDSGTFNAIVHDALVKFKKESEYTKVISKIGANASLASMILIILLPYLTKIDMVMPLKINLIFDVIGLFAVLTIVSPKKEKAIAKKDRKGILTLIKEARGNGFLPIAIFTGLFFGFVISESIFRNVYLEYLGYPIILIGFVKGLSRLVWFIVGHKMHT